MSSQFAAPNSTATLVNSSSRHALVGAAISAIGLAHIVRPELFASLNRQMFTRNIRRHVYINGAIETLIGVAMIAPRARRFVPVLGALYVTYLGGNIVRRRRASPGDA
jgi:uncharacterized membrane protein